MLKRSILLFVGLLILSFVGCMPVIEKILYAGKSRIMFPTKQYAIFPHNYSYDHNENVYFSMNTELGNDIWGFNIIEKSSWQLTSAEHVDYDPVPSPDGKKILFSRGALFGNREYFICDSNGQNERLLFPNSSIYLGEPIWSMDGKTIYFIGGAEISDSSFASEPRKNTQDLFAISVDGTGLKRLTRLGVTSWMSSLFTDWAAENVYCVIYGEDEERMKTIWQLAGIVEHLDDPSRSPYETGLYCFSLVENTLTKVYASCSPESKNERIHVMIEGYVGQSRDMRRVLFRDQLNGIQLLRLDELSLETLIKGVNGTEYRDLPESIQMTKVSELSADLFLCLTSVDGNSRFSIYSVSEERYVEHIYPEMIFHHFVPKIEYQPEASNKGL